jgi:hypothetical protein
MNSFDGNQLKKMSTGQYYFEGKVVQRRKWDENVKKSNEDEYGSKVGNLSSLKTARLDGLRAAIKSRLEHSRALLSFCSSKAFRKWRFKVDRFQRKSLAKACKGIVQGLEGKVCVGIGDWSQPEGFKGLPTAPLKRLFNEFKHHVDKVVYVQERNTSKVCSKCESETVDHVHFRGVAMKRFKVKKLIRSGEEVPPPSSKDKLSESHQVVRCCSNECAMCWQRDVNACRNIHKLLWLKETGLERPEIFTKQLSKQTACVDTLSEKR